MGDGPASACTQTLDFLPVDSPTSELDLLPHPRIPTTLESAATDDNQTRRVRERFCVCPYSDLSTRNWNKRNYKPRVRWLISGAG